MSDKEGTIKLQGLVTESLPNAQFRISLDNGEIALSYISGSMRRHRIKVLPGDKVEIEFTPYDLTKGRITRRIT